ncbi:MAG TPA: hypothetical protein VF668_01340 [Pyrinomonadaceae bacterium]|jgi:hypothetical protein
MKKIVGRILIENAPGCAWRGLYVSLILVHHERSPLAMQLFRVTFDPNNLQGAPTLSLGLLGNGIPYDLRTKTRVGKLLDLLVWNWRVRLPYLRWRSDAGSVRRFFYAKQQKFLRGMDGRYGWGTERRRLKGGRA